MKHTDKLMFFLASILMLLLGSCKRHELLMNIKFGMQEKEWKDAIRKLVENKEIIVSRDELNDTGYYYDLNLNGIVYKSHVYFNDDGLGTGTLRSFDYCLNTLPYSQSGNDTIEKNGRHRKIYTTVIKASDFEHFKADLDSKYGKGVFIPHTEKSSFLDDTSYKYTTETADLVLVQGKRVVDNYFGLPIKVPFYDHAVLKVQSKTFDVDFQKEKEVRRLALKPEDVLSIYFQAPTLDDRINDYGNIETCILLKTNFPQYKTHVIDNQIIECKGVLAITDAYNDTLEKVDMIYKFVEPLTPVLNSMIYPSYRLNVVGQSRQKLSSMIKAGYQLKAYFKPIAVALDNGEVIR